MVVVRCSGWREDVVRCRVTSEVRGKRSKQKVGAGPDEATRGEMKVGKVSRFGEC